MLMTKTIKIRDAAGDALTGLVSVAETPSFCLRLLEGLEDCGANEVSLPIHQSPEQS
jgi:hypothetical protein